MGVVLSCFVWMVYGLQLHCKLHCKLCFYLLILKGNRDESTTVDVAKAQKEAQDLFQVQTIVIKLLV